MPMKPRKQVMSNADFRIQREAFDIIECALNNDFGGVDRELKREPRSINAQRTGSGITATMAASGRGLEEMVVHLLSKDGVDITIVDDLGKNAFDHARPFPKIVSALVLHKHPNLQWKEPGLFPK